MNTYKVHKTSGNGAHVKAFIIAPVASSGCNALPSVSAVFTHLRGSNVTSMMRSSSS